MYNTPKADMILGNGMYTFMSLYTIVKKGINPDTTRR